MAAQKVIISHPGPGSWLCSCEYALVYGIYTVKGSPLQSFAVAIAVPMLHRMQSYKQGSMVQTSQQCLKTATALSHWQLKQSRAALKMLHFTPGFDLEDRLPHGAGSPGSMLLPRPGSGLFLCGLSAAESLAQCWLHWGVHFLSVRVCCMHVACGCRLWWIYV